MKKIRNYYIIFITITFISCSNKVELKGYWQGQRVIDNSNTPVLIKFENNLFIDFWVNDTIKYTQTKNKLYLNYKYGEQETINYKVEDSTLYFYIPKTDSLISKFKRPKSKNLIDDITLTKSYSIQLPVGKGFMKKFNISYDIKEPLYIFYENDKLNINFKEQKRIVDDNLHKFIKENGKYLFEEKGNISISLIADKSIKLTEIEFIKRQLRVAGYDKITFLLSSNKYDFSNSLKLRLEPLLKIDTIKYKLKLGEFELTEMLPEFNKKNSILVNLNDSNPNISGQSYSLEKLQNLITQKYKSLDRVQIFYSFNNQTKYQDYISVLDVVYNSIIDLRKNYLKEKYNIDYYSNKYEDRELLRESMEKYPLIFGSERILK